MIRTKDVLPFRIELFLVDHFEGDANENEQALRPPTVELPHEPELLWKNNGDKQQEKENDEKEKENYNAVKSIEAPDEFHEWVD